MKRIRKRSFAFIAIIALILTVTCATTSCDDLLADIDMSSSLQGIDTVDMSQITMPESGDGSSENSEVPENKKPEDDTWKLLDYYPLADGTYGVKIGNAMYLENINIPSVYDGKAVTRILENGFNSSTVLKKVYIPASVETIDKDSFSKCATLTEVTFEEGSALKTIGDSAFYQTGITSAYIPSNVESIGSHAFAHIYEDNNGDGMRNAGDFMSKITSVTFESGSKLKNIGEFAFQGALIEELTIPSSVEYIGQNAFAECVFLEKVSFGNDSKLRTIGSYAFQYTLLTEIIIPASVETIEANAFLGCYELNTVTFELTNGWNNAGPDDNIDVSKYLENYSVCTISRVTVT